MLNWLNEGTLSPYQHESVPSSFRSYQLAQADPKPVMTARDLMSTPVVTAQAEWTLTHALKMMRDREISHLPVVSGDCLVGLVSDRDLLEHISETPLLVQTVMSNRLLTATPETNLWLIARIILAEGVHCVVIVDGEGVLEGILTSLDLLRCMTYHAPVEVWL